MILLKILVLCLLSVGALTGACVANSESDGNCNDWLAKSVKLVESRPFAKGERLKTIFIQISDACSQIPEKLIRAARHSIDAGHEQRYKILKKASASYFPKSCLDNPSLEPAKYLVYYCGRNYAENLPYTAVMPYISSGEYMYGIALEKELNKNSNLNPFHAKRLILNYLKSAAVLFEERLGL